MTLPGEARKRSGDEAGMMTCSLLDLKDAITSFLWWNAAVYTREQWLDAYPEPTEHV